MASPHISPSSFFNFDSLDNEDLEFIDRSAFGRLVVHSTCVLISKIENTERESLKAIWNICCQSSWAVVHAPRPIILYINLYSHLYSRFNRDAINSKWIFLPDFELLSMVMKTENKEYDKKIGQVSQCVVVVVFLEESQRICTDLTAIASCRDLMPHKLIPSWYLSQVVK